MVSILMSTTLRNAAPVLKESESEESEWEASVDASDGVTNQNHAKFLARAVGALNIFAI